MDSESRAAGHNSTACGLVLDQRQSSRHGRKTQEFSMRYALVNPAWEFEGSIYFGCREAHLPLELGYARQLLESAGHSVLYCDAHLDSLSLADVRRNVAHFKPDLTIIPT